MASTVPPIAAPSSSSIPERFTLPQLPEIPGVDVEREPIDAFRLAAAKLIADAWNEPIEKLFTGVDTGKFWGYPALSAILHSSLELT